jgi:hypothetical protein
MNTSNLIEASLVILVHEDRTRDKTSMVVAEEGTTKIFVLRSEMPAGL